MHPWASFMLGMVAGAVMVVGAGALVVWRATADLDEAGWTIGGDDDHRSR